MNEFCFRNQISYEFQHIAIFPFFVKSLVQVTQNKVVFNQSTRDFTDFLSLRNYG